MLAATGEAMKESVCARQSCALSFVYRTMRPLRHIARDQILRRAAALPRHQAADPLASATEETALNSLWHRRRSGPVALAAGAALARQAIEEHGGAVAAVAALGL